jgi:hypothetical protein
MENARLYELARQRAEALEGALREVRELRKLISMCAFCRRVRDPEKGWVSQDEYLHRSIDLAISYGLRPKCSKGHYPKHPNTSEDDIAK